MNKKEWINNQRGQQTTHAPELTRTSSMTTLAIWNINKALEKNPGLNIKAALKKAQEGLENEQVNVSAIVRQRHDERHLSCALLAWQQLGHSHYDSLYSFFIEHKKVELKSNNHMNKPTTWGSFGICKQPCEPRNNLVFEESSFIAHKESDHVASAGSFNVAPSSTAGPVLKLPPVHNHNRVVPVYNVRGGGCQTLRKTGQDIKNRIEKACCLESGCIDKLAAVDKETKELRQRLGKLAKREAERIELLERAEIAWRDLEMGYMRRHRSCVEKEEDIVRESTKLIAERNNNKEICSKLVVVVKPRGELAEKARVTLKKLETDVCDVACQRLKQSEMASKEEAILSDIQVKSNQQDRDLMFKEEETRRKLSTIRSELESVRGLMFEEERTLKAELKGFKDQLKDVSKELFEEDAAINKIKEERDELLEEKRELTEDLEGCQQKCDSYMQKRVEELNQKRIQLQALKEQVLDCKCKFPMEIAVQVKRTPSLAALCYCTVEDRAVKSCSCTSIRSRLLSDLFISLFEGLQSEMGEISIKMPCQLLKCLEDSHNWDKPSVTKSNLRSFFARLLCGELDIAIVNSIENYHAKWVGASCADHSRTIPDLDGPEIEGWQDRALAQKAHWMAEAMAEEMFNKKVKEIMEQAENIVSSAPPPCKCKPPEDTSAVYRCLLEPVKFTRLPIVPPSHLNIKNVSKQTVDMIPSRMSPTEEIITPAIVSTATNTDTPKKKTRVLSPKKTETKTNPRSCWQCNKSDVVLLRAQIQHLKKESLKKQDLKLIEQSIKRLVQQRASGPDATAGPAPPGEKQPIVENSKMATCSKLFKNKTVNSKTKTKIENVSQYPKIKRQYAVNMCFCGVHRNMPNPEKCKKNEATGEIFTASKPETSRDMLSLISMEQYKPTDQIRSDENKLSDTYSKLNLPPERKMTCGSNCACFNKIPSCTSIDRFLDTLAKWNCDINVLPNSNNNLINSPIHSKNYVEPIPYVQRPVTGYQPNEMSVDLSKNNDLSAIVCHSTVTIGGLKTIVELNRPGKVDKTENDERNFKIPAATVSEYMGAVNLEKSNENFCKSITDKEQVYNSAGSKKDVRDVSFRAFELNISEIKNETQQKRKIKSEEYTQRKGEFDFERKTKSQEIYDRKKIRDKKENNASFLNKIHRKLSSSSRNVAQDRTILQEKNKPLPFIIVDERFNQLKKPDSKTHKRREPLILRKDCCLNTSDNFTCDCENEIKLLGVTLANLNPGTKIINKFNERTVETNEFPKVPKSFEDNIYSSLNSFPSKPTPKSVISNYDQLYTNITDIQQPSCQCKINFDELKALLKNASKEKIVPAKDKLVDTNSIKECSKEEDCVCCENIVDQSNELEVNLFQLLKEHLQKKFENLKTTCQSSYNMKPEEESEVVSKIFEKIKQTIAQTTGNITCKCSEEASNESSWQRAYNLLQEYLKIKISRVQCNCSSLKQNNEQKILPELTDKVCQLIEKDFERLKDICKLKSEKKSELSNMNEEMQFQMPEKDIEENNKSKKVDKTDSIGIKKGSLIQELSKCYVIATCNTSAQIIPNFETRSCEAIKIEDAYDKTTVETQSSNTEYLKKTCSIDCNILDDRKVEQCTTGTDQLQDDLCEKRKEMSKSYIGYTMDCTCTPNLGTCVCARSRVIQNREMIKDIWSNCIKNKKNNQNTEYIMEKVNKKVDIIPYSHFFYENDMLSTICKKETTTAIETSTCEMENLTLKTSWENVNIQHKHSGTNTQNNDMLSLNSDISNDEEWFESETPKNELFDQKKKSVHFLHRSKSEILKNESSKVLGLIQTECDCRKVPVCHVKMLVENIENKLANSECTCDALSASVCPIHSKNNNLEPSLSNVGNKQAHLRFS